jgi:hypothetical protein
MAVDYGKFLREELRADSDWAALPSWDYFISAFNRSDRLRLVYDRVRASEKLWLVHPEYVMPEADLPPEAVMSPDAADESSFIREVVAELRGKRGYEPDSHSLCIDITGLMRPHILYLLWYLEKLGVTRVHMLYAEPDRYADKEKTSFSAGSISEVRPVQGYEGSPNTDTSNDLLILGMGYDDRMTAEVAEDKGKAAKFQLFGLPPLRADMYQESVIRSRAAADSLGDPDFSPANRGFAPANDPFATASTLVDVFKAKCHPDAVTNLYLSPLGTKAQVLGFGLFYLGEKLTNASILYPFSTQYTAETSLGLSRAWIYRVELPVSA